MQDEQAIRDLLATWQRAAAESDLSTLAKLVAEDVVFLVPDQPPIEGCEAFMALQREVARRFRLAIALEIRELTVTGDWAYCWTQLAVTMTPKDGGAPMKRSGPTLSIFRKQRDGSWVLTRDANLVTAEPAND